MIQQLYSVFLFAINSGTSFSEVYGGDKIYWSYKAFFFKGGLAKKKGGNYWRRTWCTPIFFFFFDPLESTNKNKSRNICLYPTNKIRHKRNTCYVRLLSFS